MTGVYKNMKVSGPRNQIFVNFETISKVPSRGFKASIHENGDSCQYWMDLENQRLSSPYYPQAYFNDYIGCEWLITAPEGHVISLEFDHFDVSKNIISKYLKMF